MQTTSRNFERASSTQRLIQLLSRWVTLSTLDLLKGCRMTLFVGRTHTQLWELREWARTEPSLEGLVHRPRKGIVENCRL